MSEASSTGGACGGQAMRKARRALLSAAFFCAYGALSLLFAPLLILPLWSKRTFRALIRFFYRAFVACARATGLFRVRIDEASLKALAGARGKVVAMNHLSLIDIVVLIAHLPDSTAIAKPQVLRNPFLAIVAKKMFIVNTGDAGAVVAAAAGLLAQGVNIVVFPQGTRGGETLHRGAARLALAARRSVLCVRIDYSPLVLAKGQPWWDVGERTIEISLALRATLSPRLANTRAAAKALTAEIACAIQSAH